MAKKSLERYIEKINPDFLENVFYFISGFSIAMNIQDFITDKYDISNNISSLGLLVSSYVALKYIKDKSKNYST